MVNNFIKNGIDPNNINILVSTPENCYITEDWIKLENHFSDVNFSFYTDTRKSPSYISSIRPHILKKHFQRYPELENESFLYHDCDIVFTKPIDFSKFLYDDVWYASDTKFYTGASYIKSKECGIYETMCDIIGIDPSIPMKNEENSGGAQYIMKNLTKEYWEKVENDSELLYKFFLKHLETHPETPEYHPIQMWTADMWSVLWNAWLFGHDVRIHNDLEFIWPNEELKMLKDRSILHNSGVTGPDQDMFYKGNFIHEFPYEQNVHVNQNKASSLYWNEVCETAKKSCLI